MHSRYDYHNNLKFVIEISSIMLARQRKNPRTVISVKTYMLVRQRKNRTLGGRNYGSAERKYFPSKFLLGKEGKYEKKFREARDAQHFI